MQHNFSWSQAVLVGALLVSVNCSKVHFNEPAAGSDSSASAASSASSTITASGGDISNAGGAAGVITGIGTTPPASLPKVSFLGPPCASFTNCPVTFQLDKAYQQRVEFDWKTRDDLYGQATPNGVSAWGQPNVQYVPTSGHIVFTPGTTAQTVFVRNINPQPTTISIGVLMTQCTFGGLLESCAGYFN